MKKWERRYNFYERNEWTEALYKRSCEEAKSYKPFQWKSDFKAKDMAIEFSETKDFAKPIVEKLPDGSCRVIAYGPDGRHVFEVAAVRDLSTAGWHKGEWK